MTKDKSLKDKAVNIKGKNYVQVNSRVSFFNDNYENGCIQTNLLSYEGTRILMKAKVIPDIEKPDKYFIGHAQEKQMTEEELKAEQQKRKNPNYLPVNYTSALENAETSAVGRALAFMDIGVIDSIASVDEINKANNRKPNYSASQQPSSDLGNCKKCGAKNALAKTGNIYCSAVCWNKK